MDSTDSGGSHDSQVSIAQSAWAFGSSKMAIKISTALPYVAS